MVARVVCLSDEPNHQIERMPKSKGKKGSKKKGKKKIAVSEKEKLEENANQFLKDSELHQLFINRISKWMVENCSRVIDIFKKFDQNGDNFLTFDEFYAGMRDLEAPCSSLELVVLAKTVDQDHNNLIDYTEFAEGIRYRHPTKQHIDDGRPVLSIIRESLEKCPNCKILRQKSEKDQSVRYVNLEVKLSMMAKVPHAPCHLTTVVHSHISIEGIAEMLRHTYQHAIKNVTLYAMNDNIKFDLEMDRTLEDHGYVGGSENDPQRVVIYYDVSDNQLECPILQCDHYFERSSSKK